MIRRYRSPLHTMTALSLLLMWPGVSVSQKQQIHPLLTTIREHGLVIPESQWQQRTTIKVGKVSCRGAISTYANLLGFGIPTRYDFEYDFEVTIDDDRDACSDAESVPEVKTRLLLVFQPGSDPGEIAFEGDKPEGCVDCRPKRVTHIAGRLTDLGGGRFGMVFRGDLEANLRLEYLK